MSLHLLPGLGATSALYSGYSFPFTAQALEYPCPPGPGCSFDGYAAFLIRQYGIRAGDCLIGVSLGGMLACEISKQVRIAKLTLISSGTQREHLHPWLTRLSFLGPYVPWAQIQRVMRPLPGLSEARRQAVAMFREADPDFVRWACSCAADWPGLVEHEDLVSIHGDCDLVFPIRRQRVHHTIKGGGHLMVISQRVEILQLLLTRHGVED